MEMLAMHAYGVGLDDILVFFQKEIHQRISYMKSEVSTSIFQVQGVLACYR